MKKFILSSFLFFVVYANSQNAWTLQQCIKYALEHNIGLKQSALNNEVTHNNATQSKANMLPSINGGATHVYNIGKTIDRYTNTFAINQTVLSQNFYVGGNLTLWSGLSQYNNMRANEYSYKSGVENLRQQEYDLSLSIANAYINVIFCEELLKISQSQYDVTKEQLERTQKLVDAGAAAKSNEYDMKSQLATEDFNVISADNNYQLAILNLKQLMNLDSVSNFSVARPDMDLQGNQLLENYGINSLYETSLKNQPSIKSSEYAIQSAEHNLAASRGRISPSLAFNANIGTGTSGLDKNIDGVKYLGMEQAPYYTQNGEPIYMPKTEVITSTKPFSTQFKNNVNKSLGFTLSVPIFNGLQTSTAVKNAKINSFNAKLSQDLAKQNLYKSIAQAHANARAALNKYNASKSSVEASTEAFNYAQQKFNAGVISALDFSTAKNRLFAAESNMLQAKYDFIFKLKVLEYYEGKPLEF